MESRCPIGGGTDVQLRSKPMCVIAKFQRMKMRIPWFVIPQGEGPNKIHALGELGHVERYHQRTPPTLVAR